MGDPLHDDRLTLVGLFVESNAGLHEILGRHLERECDLPRQWFEVLVRLARSPAHRLRMSDLAAQTTMSPSGLTRVVDRLADAGLVVRSACPSDRRGYFAEVTTDGLRRVRRAVPKHLARVEESFTGHLTPRERQQLEALLRKIRDHVRPGSTAGT